jgi:hypothetical protein
VKDCGLGTDIVVVRRNGFLEGVSAGVVREMENIFRYYANFERNTFHYCIGLDTEQTRLLRTQLGREPLLNDLEQLRNKLTQWDEVKGDK